MTKKEEDSLQEIVEQLESGAAVEAVVAGLPAEEAEVVHLIATMQTTPFPTMDAATIDAQEAEVVAAAAQMGAAPTTNSTEETAVTAVFLSYFKSWFTYLQSRRQLSYGLAGAFLVLMLFVAVWQIRSGGLGSDPTLAHLPFVKDIAVAPEAAETDMASGAAETDSAASQPNGAGAESLPAVSGATTFLPMVTLPFDLNAHTALLENRQGVVELQAEDGSWQAVSQKDSISAGQHIRTGAYSSASLTFYDGSVATLGPHTEISLEQVDAQKRGEGLRTIVMKQWSGSSEHEVDFRGDAGSRYEVLTPNGSGRARGTSFQVAVSPDTSTQYIVSHGRVEVTNVNVTVFIVAGQTSVIPPQEPPSQPYFTVSGEGEVTAVGETWTIGSQTFNTTTSTVTVGNPQVGDIVSVFGYMLPDGTLVATYIALLHEQPTSHFSLTGLVESITDAEWQIAGQPISVNEETAIDLNLQVGDTARATGMILEDGTLMAEQIEQIDDGLPFSFTGIVEAIADDSWNISDISIAVDENTAIDDDIAVGDVVNVEGEILADGTWLAAEIERQDDELSTFEFSGQVQSVDPWNVNGIALATDSFTQIDSDIAVGDQVVASGQILADGTWLASEIRLLNNEQLTFSFVGVVSSIDPWVIGDIEVDVDENTLIDEEVTIGTEVQVQGIILPDGTLLAQIIEPLDDESGEINGCFTYTTVIISINGNQIQLQGFPLIQMDDSVPVDGDLVPDSTITVSICIGQDGNLIIVNIIIIQVPLPPPTQPPTTPPNDGNGKVTICHKNKNTLSISQSAVPAHLGHGDTLGACTGGGN